jgi:ribosome-associated protein
VNALIDLDELARQVTFQPLRAGGPGGQHRNKVETAVRATHTPTGLSVVAADHRSQIRNKREALDRLHKKLVARARRPKIRRKTKPSRSAIKRRLEQKKRRSQKKMLRRRSTD